MTNVKISELRADDVLPTLRRRVVKVLKSQRQGLVGVVTIDSTNHHRLAAYWPADAVIAVERGPR